MKNITSCISIIFFFLFINLSLSSVSAQDEQPAEQPLGGGQQPTQIQPQNPPINRNSSNNTSGSVTARACVKVGAPSEPKPAICNQPSKVSFGGGIPGNFTFYCQGDPKWDQKGNTCSTGQVGCGPTSLAMIFTYFGDTVTPDQMFKTYFDNNMISCEKGSFPDSVKAWVAKQPGYEIGSNIGKGALNIQEAKKYIDDGWLILGSSDNFKVQKGSRIGHIFVVQDVDPVNETIILRDPENCSYGNGEEFQANIVQPVLGDKIPNWKYAYPIRKERTQPQPVPGGTTDAF